MMGKRGTIRRLLAALCAIALASCSTPHKEPAPVAETAADFSCKRAEAKPVKLAQLRRNPMAFADQCVALSVFTNGTDFGETAASLRAPPAKGDKFLAYYFDDTRPNRQLPKHPSFIDIVARVRACPASAPKTCLDGIFVSDVRVVPTAMD